MRRRIRCLEGFLISAAAGLVAVLALTFVSLGTASASTHDAIMAYVVVSASFTDTPAAIGSMLEHGSPTAVPENTYLANQKLGGALEVRQPDLTRPST